MDNNENIIPDLGPMTDLKTAIKRGAVTLLAPDQSQYNLSTPGGEAVPMSSDDSSLLPSESPPPLVPLSETTPKKIFYLKSFEKQFGDLQPQRIKSMCSEAQPKRAIPKSSSIGSSIEKDLTKFPLPNVMETVYPVEMSPALPSESGSILKNRIPFKPIMLQHFATTEAEPGESLLAMPSTSSAKPRHLAENRNPNDMKNLMLKSTTVASRIVETTIPKITRKMAPPLPTSFGMQYPISTWTCKEHSLINFTTTGADPPATTSSFKAPPKVTSTVTSMPKSTASMEPPFTFSSEENKDILQMPSEKGILRKSRKQKFPVRPEETLEFPNKLMTIGPIPSTVSSSKAGSKRQSPYTLTFEKPSKTTEALVPRAKIGDLKSDDDPITPSMELQIYHPLSTSSVAECQQSIGLSSEKRTKNKQKKKKKSSMPSAKVTGLPDDGKVSKPKTKKSKPKVPKAMTNKLPVTALISMAQLPIVSTTAMSETTTTTTTTTTSTTFTSYKLVKCACIGNMPSESVVKSSMEIVHTTTLPIAPIVELPMSPIVELPMAPIVELPMGPIVELPMAPIVELPMAPIVELPMAPIVTLPIAPIVEVPMAMHRTSVENPQSTIAPIPEEYSLFQPWHISMTAPTLESPTDSWDMSIPIMTEPPLILMADTSPELELLQPDPSPPIEEALGNTDAGPRTDENPMNPSMQNFLFMDSMFSSTRSNHYIIREIHNSAITSGNFGPEILDQIADIL